MWHFNPFDERQPVAARALLLWGYIMVTIGIAIPIVHSLLN